MFFITFFLAQTVDSSSFLYQMYPTKILLRILPIPILEYLSPTWMQWIGFTPFCWNCSLGHKNCFGNRPAPFAEISSNEPKINKNWGWVWKARWAVFLLRTIVLVQFGIASMVGAKKQDFWTKINIPKGIHCILCKYSEWRFVENRTWF